MRKSSGMKSTTKKPFSMNYKTYDTSQGYGSEASWRAAFADRMGVDEARIRVGDETPQDILGVSMNATWTEIKTAYRQACLAWHPDRAKLNGLTEAEATEHFKKIQAAYVVLENRHKK